MELEIQELGEDRTRVALVGRADVQGLHGVDARFHATTAGRGKPTVVDLSRLEFIASLGMGMLISCAQSLRRKGAAMVLLGPEGMVAETLHAAGVDAGIPIVRDEAEALSALGLAG